MQALRPTETREAAIRGQSQPEAGSKVGWGEEPLSKDAAPKSEMASGADSLVSEFGRSKAERKRGF